MTSDFYFKRTLFKLEYLYVLIMAQGANPGGGAEYREVIKNYVGEKLRRSGIIVNGYETEEVNEPILEIAATLRRVGDELERSSAEFFGNMCNQLHITRNNAHQIFQGVCDEIFLTGTNWGRIVAFLTFGSTFAVHCASRGDLGPEYVDRVVNWIANYMELNLDQWMRQHGSWEGFLNFFHRTDTENNSQSGFIVSALAGIGIGALLMMTFK